ncbi:TPA: hypothetical protein DEG21_06130 [Patescibacteria group bacterium]|nr:hypothetical protein [Candidatus Gracilibacteria bacterium]
MHLLYISISCFNQSKTISSLSIFTYQLSFPFLILSKLTYALFQSFTITASFLSFSRITHFLSQKLDVCLNSKP